MQQIFSVITQPMKSILCLCNIQRRSHCDTLECRHIADTRLIIYQYGISETKAIGYTTAV